MTIAVPADPASGPSEVAGVPSPGDRLGPGDVLRAGGIVGPAGRVARGGDKDPRKGHQPDRPARTTTPHFVWTIPLSNSLLFFVAGLLLALVTRRSAACAGRGSAIDSSAPPL